jgi:hypothetical protein
MHYKNGREAHNGDKVIVFSSYGAPYAGILYDAVAANDYCNGRIAVTSPADPQPNLKECLRADDVVEIITTQLERPDGAETKQTIPPASA